MQSFQFSAFFSISSGFNGCITKQLLFRCLLFFFQNISQQLWYFLNTRSFLSFPESSLFWQTGKMQRPSKWCLFCHRSSAAADCSAACRHQLLQIKALWSKHVQMTTGRWQTSTQTSWQEVSKFRIRQVLILNPLFVDFRHLIWFICDQTPHEEATKAEFSDSVKHRAQWRDLNFLFGFFQHYRRKKSDLFVLERCFCCEISSKKKTWFHGTLAPSCGHFVSLLKLDSIINEMGFD